MESILQMQNVATLRRMVREWTNSHRIRGYSTMKKADLVEAINKDLLFRKKEDDEMLEDVVKRLAVIPDKLLESKAQEHSRKAQPKAEAKKEEVVLGGEKVQFKEGALRSMLRLTPKEKLTKPLIRKMLQIPVGGRLEYFNKVRKQTPLLRKRLEFALTLMKGK